MRTIRLSLTDDIFERLKDDIIKLRLKQGEFLTEAELAQRFKVSKTPVREALNRLKSEGFIETLPHKGYLITGLSVGDIKNLFQFRLILEQASAELAVKYATNEDIVSMEKLAEESFVLVDEESFIKYNEINYQFHLLLAQTSRNPLLVSALSNVLNQLRRVLLMDLRTTHAEEMSKSHRMLVDMIKQKNSKKVWELMQKHILDAEQRIYNYRVLI